MERQRLLPSAIDSLRPRDSKHSARCTRLPVRMPITAAVSLFLLLSLLLAAPRVSLAGFPLHGAKAAKAPVPAPPPTVLPPPGFPPPAVYGFPETGYRSGWYNTHYWPRKNYHHGFYGDYWQWGYFPGY